MTPNTPAGGAVAWRHVHFRDGKRIGTGPWRDIGERINEQQGDDIEYAYTTPPATVPLDAVRVLLAEYDALAQHFDHDRAGRKLRDELEALTRGEK